MIYPDTVSRLADAELTELLQLVQLGGLVEREGGWGATADWMDVLSGGEKQRVAVRGASEIIVGFTVGSMCFIL